MARKRPGSARLLDAATYFQYRLPEIFAGYPRVLTCFSVEYSNASSPQAWAAGTTLLLLRVLLGLEPGAGDLRNDPVLPDSVDRISLTRIHWRTTRVDVEASVSR
jgi:glycogen debranching enzyme